MFAALRHRDYSLLLFAQSVSFLGDQFHLIAMPWLALQLSGDPLQMALVIAAASVPRALLMLVGGASADRYSPRWIMIASDVVRFLLAGFLAVATLGGFIQMWQLYLVALAFGTVSGFFQPAANVAIPRLLDDSELESGNALMQFLDNVMSFLGPALAGMLIALFGQQVVGTDQVASLRGIGIAHGVDALSFAVSAVCLLLMRPMPAAAPTEDARPLRDIAEGFRHVRSRPEVMWLYIYMLSASMFAAGPILVGAPVAAAQRLGGAVAFGLIMSAFSAGNLLGMMMAASLPRPTPRTFKTIAVGSFVMFSIAIASLGLAQQMWQVLPFLALAGLGNGYSIILFFSLVQRITPPEMTGRAMSIMLLAMYGISPISQALSGLIVSLNPEALFLGASACLLATAVVMAVRQELGMLAEHFGPALAQAAEA